MNNNFYFSMSICNHGVQHRVRVTGVDGSSYDEKCFACFLDLHKVPYDLQHLREIKDTTEFNEFLLKLRQVRLNLVNSYVKAIDKMSIEDMNVLEINNILFETSDLRAENARLRKRIEELESQQAVT